MAEAAGDCQRSWRRRRRGVRGCHHRSVQPRFKSWPERFAPWCTTSIQARSRSSGRSKVLWAGGTGPKKFSEQFAYLMAYKGHVTLGFYRGGELSDPEGLLPQKGGTQVSGSLSMRSLKIASLDEVQQPALGALIHESLYVGIPHPQG